MCGIIGYHGVRSKAALDTIQRMLVAASYRGTHATGMAYLQDGELVIESAPVSAEDFVDCYDLSAIAPNERKLSFIGHTRYCTSGLTNNQPLQDYELALVMNGVISQDTPDKWPLNYQDEPYTTDNDVEVAVRYAKHGLRGDMPGSFAILELWKDGRMLAYRNGDRPLHWTSNGGGDFFYSSTEDILQRVFGTTRTSTLLAPGLVHNCCKPEVVGEFPSPQERQKSKNTPLRRLRCPIG